MADRTKTGKSMVPTTFAHIGLTCRDQKVIEDFYTKHFGFKRARVLPLGEENIIFVKSGSVCLELFKAKEECPVVQPEADGYPWAGLRHLAFAVENVETKIAEMGDDAKVTLGPSQTPGRPPGTAPPPPDDSAR